MFGPSALPTWPGDTVSLGPVPTQESAAFP